MANPANARKYWQSVVRGEVKHPNTKKPMDPDIRKFKDNMAKALRKPASMNPVDQVSKDDG